MDIFAIKKGKAFKISIDEFENQTRKDFPYYRINEKKKLLCYAICHECGNPIQIVNMYGKEMMQEVTNKIVAYGKHTTKAVNGFPYWNEAAKKNCSLYNPPSLENKEIRASSEESEQIRKIVEQNWQKIKRDIREIVGINLSNKTLEYMKDVFINSNAYSYKAVNQYNIPYAMLRYQGAILIYNGFLLDSYMGEIIKDKINSNSLYFEVENNRIVKKSEGYHSIKFYFTKHNRINGKQYIHMVISEGGNNKFISNERIEMKSYIYR